MQWLQSIMEGKSWDYTYFDEGKEYGNSAFMANSLGDSPQSSLDKFRMEKVMRILVSGYL